MTRKAQVSKQEVVKDESFIKSGEVTVPDYLKGMKKTASLGNTDSTDLIIPRVKLLQSTSDEPKTFNGAKMGYFWHSIAGVSMGEKVAFIPILVRKSLVLWAPRGDTRGVLARSSDCINWDRPDETFEVKLKGVKNPVKWRIGKDVKDGGLANFGTQNPEDSDSPPAAALTYNILSYFPDFPDLSPAIILNTRSSAKRAKLLISKIEMTPYDAFAQRYVLTASTETGAEGEYYNYMYTKDGFATAEQYALCKEKHELFNQDPTWRADDTDASDVQVGGGEKEPPVDATKRKF